MKTGGMELSEASGSSNRVVVHEQCQTDSVTSRSARLSHDARCLTPSAVTVDVAEVWRIVGADVENLKALVHLGLNKRGRTLVAFVDVFLKDRAMVLASVFAAFYDEQNEAKQLRVGVVRVVDVRGCLSTWSAKVSQKNPRGHSPRCLCAASVGQDNVRPRP